MHLFKKYVFFLVKPIICQVLKGPGQVVTLQNNKLLRRNDPSPPSDTLMVAAAFSILLL